MKAPQAHVTADDRQRAVEVVSIVLAGLVRGDTMSDLGIPESGFLNIEASQIRSDNVEEFWAELKKNLGEQ